MSDAGSTTELARAVAQAGSGEETKLRHVAVLVARSAREAGAKAVASGQWLADVTLEVAGHLPVRDLATLREHHDGLAGPLLAKVLIRNAALTTAAVGVATGALAAASETSPMTWGTLPIELVVETLVVVGVEMKLVAELHEAAGLPLPQDFRMKAPLIARSWADVRGVRREDVLSISQVASAGVTAPLAGAATGMLGRSARDQLTSQLRRRLIRRTGKNVVAFTPLLIGGAVGAVLNRRMTRRLGLEVAGSLGIPPPR